MPADIIVGLGRLPWAARVEEVAEAFAARLGAGVTRVHAGPTDAIVGGRHDVLQREGPAAAVLQDEAEARHADLIIVGTGATGERPELGTTTRQMLRTISMPLLVVPTHGSAPRPPSPRIDCVLAPTDLTGRTQPAAESARTLAARLGVPLVLIHVDTRNPGDRVAAIRGLEAAAAALGPTPVAFEAVSARTVAEGIAARASALNAIVALPSHGKGTDAQFVVGKTTERIVAASVVPVLVLPP